MKNPGFWGDPIFWGEYPLWSARAAAELRLSPLRLVAETTRTYRKQATARLQIAVLHEAVTWKTAPQTAVVAVGGTTSARVGAAIRAASTLSVRQHADAFPVVRVSAYSGLRAAGRAAVTERLGPVTRQSFWGGGYRAVVYQTAMAVPDAADGATLRLVPHLESGRISRLEYGYGAIEKFWSAAPLWGDAHFWGTPDEPDEWLLWGNGLDVHAGEYIMVRLITSSAEPARICDLEWIFDVEDAELEFNDVSVPAGGLRLDVPPHYFRWINVINFGLQYIEGETAMTPAWVDKGIIEDGGVVQGPTIVCLDKNGQPAPGNVDVRLQGARGKKYGDVA